MVTFSRKATLRRHLQRKHPEADLNCVNMKFQTEPESSTIEYQDSEMFSFG